MSRQALLTESGHLIAHVEVARSFWPRFRGLMLRRSMDPETGVLFPRCGSIHTFMMRMPIDVVFVRDGTISSIHPAVPPNRTLADRGCDALELVAGRAEALRLQPGDLIRTEDAPAA